jgi:hypothetical protein
MSGLDSLMESCLQLNEGSGSLTKKGSSMIAMRASQGAGPPAGIAAKVEWLTSATPTSLFVGPQLNGTPRPCHCSIDPSKRRRRRCRHAITLAWCPERCLNPASTTRVRLSGVIPSRQGREMGASGAQGREGAAAGAGLGASTSTSSPLAGGGGGSSGDLEDFFGFGLGTASAASTT